jgi:hypothetical protein
MGAQLPYTQGDQRDRTSEVSDPVAEVGRLIGAAATTLLLIAGIVTASPLANPEGADRAAVESRAAVADSRSGHVPLSVASRRRLEPSTNERRTGEARRLLRLLHSAPDREESLPPLSVAEVEALTQLGTTADAKLRVRFMQEALRTPEGTRRLRNRAQFVWQAVVGLDSRRRDEAERLLVERLTAEDTAPEARIDLAFALAALGEVKPQAAARAVERLGQLMLEAQWWEVSPAVLALAAYLNPDDVKKTAATFLRVMGGTTSGDTLRQLAEQLVVLAPRMEPKDAAEVSGYAAAIITHRMRQMKLGDNLRPLVFHLAAVPPHLQRVDALGAALVAQVAALLDRLDDLLIDPELDELVRALKALAPFLSAADARKSTAILQNVIDPHSHPVVLLAYGEAVAALAGRLGLKDAAEAAHRAAVILYRAMVAKTEHSNPVMITAGLAAVLPHLEPEEATVQHARAVDTLIRILSTETTQGDRVPRGVAELIATLATRLDPSVAAATLVLGLTDAPTCSELSESLVEVAPRVEHRHAKELAVILARSMTRPGKEYMGRAAVGLGALVARLDSKEAKEVVAIFVRAMQDSNASWILLEGLQLAAERLEAEEAKDVAASLAAALTKPNDKSAPDALAEALSAVALRLTPKDAVATLTRVMNATDNSEALQHLANGLGVVAPRLGPKEAKDAATTLTRAMIKTKHHPSWTWSGTLSRVTVRLASEDEKELAATLVRAMTQTKDPEELLVLATMLGAAATRLDSSEAALPCAKAAAILTRAMTQAMEPSSMRPLARGLAEVAVCLDKKQAAGYCVRAGETLTQAMRRTTQPEVLRELADSLAVVAERLDAKDAATLCNQAATFLTRAMTQTTEHGELAALARSLASMTEHADFKALKETAAALNRATTQTRNVFALWSLADSLGAVAARLGRAEAAAICAPGAATLTRTMSETVGEDRSRLGAALAALLDQELIWQRELRLESACSRICLSISPAALPLALALPDPALKPLPESLPAEMLVELLKHPLCVGEARRAVLGALGRRYQRTFADQWEFVRFAEKEKLDLDLAGPPRRP